ncbi:MAG: hypothetical protein LBG24_02900 [Treponema sp.]|jgi:hypothetical protein|nr:hypothetical protein [Treponema sp.]
MGFSSVLIGLSLSMDAFAVSLGSGISVKRIERRVQASQTARRRFEGVARRSPSSAALSRC